MSKDQYEPLSAYRQYMSQVMQILQITDEEEDSLLQCVRANNNVEQARIRLVEAYQSLVVGLARRFVGRCREMEFLDLVQEGNLGLLQAIERYDEERREASFRTFAFSWVRGCMLAAFWQYEGFIRIPLQKVRAIRLMNAANARLLLMLRREPTLVEAAREMDIKEQDVRELIVLQEQEILSLHSPVDEEGETLLEDVVEDSRGSASVEDDFSSVGDFLVHLTERQQAVVRLRYGEAYTQREVADLLGIALSSVAEADRVARLRLRKVLESAVA